MTTILPEGAGNKAIIEDISKKPLKVIFENNAAKEAMLAGDERFAKPWHKLADVVDVEVQMINGVEQCIQYFATINSTRSILPSNL